jgi:hypothetical protein
MSRLSRQLLALLLALLMGLAPLQGAVAGMSALSSGDQGMAGMSQMDHGAMMDMASGASVDHDCDQCNSDDCCSGSNCLSGHCATCAMALLPVLTSLVSPTATLRLSQVGDNLRSTLPASLFRPPRV